MSILTFANNATTVLAAGINAAATSCSVSAGTGNIFPSVSPGPPVKKFVATFFKNGDPTIYEVVTVTQRVGDVFTIVRAQEGTTAKIWAANDFIAQVPTAGQQAALVQVDDLQAQLNNFAPDIGSANAYRVALTPAITAHVTGMPIRFRAFSPNTAASTFNDGAGVAPLVTAPGVPTPPGTLVAGGMYTAMWDGAGNFQLTTSTGFVTNPQLTATLSAYVLTAQLTATLQNYVTSGALTTTLQNYVTGQTLTTTLANYTNTAGMNTALALKANAANAALTGNPTAPTPAASDNDTSIATTAFVKTAIANVLEQDSNLVANNGWFKHPPDATGKQFTEQWGKVNSNGGTIQVNFPLPFTLLFGVNLTMINATGSFAVINPTNIGFGCNNGFSGSQTFWRACGYT